MKKVFSLVLVTLFAACRFFPFSMQAYGQNADADSIDVLHYNLTLDMGHNTAKQLQGVAEIIFCSTKECNRLVLDLIADSVYVVSLDGTPTRGFNFDREAQTLTVYFSGRVGDTHRVSVPYFTNGHVESYGFGGLHMDEGIHYNLGAVFGESPHCYGRSLYPCRDNFYDKATYTLTITSRTGWRSLCSGLRDTSYTLADGCLTEVWQLPQPSPTYIVGASSAPWHVIETSYTGVDSRYPATLGYISHDSLRVVQHFDMLNQVVPMFERCFGPYRWGRIGYVSTTKGSMEHAQNIALVSQCMDATDLTCQMTTCHELGHAWFGNLVTCADEGDMWINEGGASFCEEVANEAIYGRASSMAYYQDNLRNVILSAHLRDGEVYRPLSPMPPTYTYGTTTYRKGALVWHSLRGLLGDSLFYACMTRLFQSCAFGNLNSYALRDSLSLYSGLDLTGFFDFHVFHPGFVDYSLETFGVNGNDRYIRIRQLLRGTDHYSHGCRVPITYFSMDRTQRHKEWITINDSVTEHTITLPFDAAFAIVDYDNELSDGCSNDSALITQRGVTEMPNTYCKIYLPEAPSSGNNLWLHMGHHFAHPTGDTLQGISRMADRYWQVTGNIWMPATGRFLYNMGGNNSSNASNLDDGFYMNRQTLDSIGLFYRPTANDPWQLVSRTRTSSSSISTGYFTAPLWRGQYTLAVCDPEMPVGIPSTHPSSNTFRLTPNPTTGDFRIDIGGYDKKIDLLLYDNTGKKVLELKGLADGDTIRHHLPAGTYVALIQNKFLSLQSQLIVL